MTIQSQPPAQPPATSNFLNALFGGHEGPLRFTLDGEIIETNDTAFVSQNDGSLRVSPSTEAGVCFLFADMTESDKEAWRDCLLEPTAVVWREGISLFCWAFENPVLPNNADLPGLMKFFRMEDPDEPVPMPGTDGWELVHVNSNTFYTPAELTQTYLTAEVVEEPAPIQEEPKPRQMYRDAVCVTPYNDLDYEGRDIWVAIGANQFAKDWKPTRLPVGGLIHQLTKHETGPKDGLSLVFGDMVKGQRKKKSVKTCTAIALDIDTGYSGEELDRRIAKLKCLAVRYTTNSHNKTSSDFLKDKILRMFPDEHAITSEMLKEYAREKERYNDDIAASVEYVEDDQTEQGIVVRVSHKPLPKHRIVVALLEPFVMKDEARLQQEAMAKWAKVIEAMANALGVKFDRACTDPSRVFFLPRHQKGRDFEISLFGGPMFNWRSLNMDDTFARIAEEATKGQSKSVTEEGRALGRWWQKYGHGFKIVDVIQAKAEDKIHSEATHGCNIECPCDEDHSNAGDSSDQACYAVNAADGPYEFFVVKCQHESCRDKTSLDMLGKMIKDGWFDYSVLEEQVFSELDFDALEDVKQSADAVDYETILEELKESVDQRGDVIKIFDAAIKAGLDSIQVEDLKAKIREATDYGKKPLNQLFTARQKAASEKKRSGGSGAEAQFHFSDEKKLAEALDKKVSVVALGAQRRFVVHDRHDIPHFLQKSDAEIAFAQYQYFWEAERAPVDGFPVWLRSSYRFSGYDEVVFQPGDKPVPENVLNLWRGWGIEPKQGDWSKMKDHIKTIVCGGDETSFKYYMAWWAHMFQDPTTKPGVAPVLKGPKGCGKSIVAKYARRLIPKNSKVVEKPKSWLGQFNAGLAHCLLLCVEEAMFAGNHEHDSAMKNLITSDTLDYEAKWQHAFQGPNFTRVHITSNEHWVVPATPGERRYFVMKVSPARVGDYEYFQAIVDQMENGGCEAFLYDMLRWDYSDINILDAPDTEGLADQISAGLGPKLNWWASVLETGCFPFKDSRGPEVTDWFSDDLDRYKARKYAADQESFEITDICGEVPKSIVFTSYRDFCPGYKGPDTDAVIVAFLDELGFELGQGRMTMKNDKRPRSFKFPGLQAMREGFLTRVPTHRFKNSVPISENAGVEKNKNKF